MHVQLAMAEFTVKFALDGKDLERDKYKTDLIKLILDNSGIDYSLYYYQEPGAHSVQIQRLKKGVITLRSLGATQEQENKFIPIRIPIFKGLIGYRVFLINKADQYKFDKIRSINDLQKLTGIQGYGWADIKIMEDAGLPQIAVKGKAIYRMVNRGGRADYFSRAVYEAAGELQTMKTAFPDVAIEKRIFLTYPFAMYFYITPQHSELAEKIRTSFQELVDSGQFDQFFYHHPYIRSAIEKAHLEDRIRFDLTNNYLSPETINLPKQYWFDMEKFREYQN